MALKKINPLNRGSVPGLGQDKNIYVKSGDFNPVVDAVNNLQGNGTAGAVAATTISASGVVTVADTTDSTTKDTGSIITEGGIGVEKAIVAGTTITAGTGGMFSDSLKMNTPLVTTPVGTVTIVEYGNGKDMTTVLTLTNFIVGALAGAGAALGVGNIVAAFPAGQHFELVYALSAISLKCAGTAVATDTGLGSVIASGAVNVLSGTGTFEDRLTGQTITTGTSGGTAVSALTAATAGIGTGIALNVAGSVKNVFLNSAGTWNANNVGNLTASGSIILKWTKMS